MNITDMFTHGLAFIIGALSLYFTAYTKTQGTNKALREDIHSLESAKQKIITKHATELESVKKELLLDIEKRKYQYEDKSEIRVRLNELLFLINVSMSRPNALTSFCPKTCQALH
ncbi:hypothetical protein [Shewanella sp. UCD-KL12]|uniref:hypothetical protein n=1 Tax=Shewanella sp. UCD-KL12 TaxID=1917163 RepID=UPI000970D88A|nr:hypothetical protein [Shewanella sp. UCD-KL12]